MGNGDKQPLATGQVAPGDGPTRATGGAGSRRARGESGAGHAGAGAEGSNGTLRALTGQRPARALRPPGKTVATARPRRPGWDKARAARAAAGAAAHTWGSAGPAASLPPSLPPSLLPSDEARRV